MRIHFCLRGILYLVLVLGTLQPTDQVSWIIYCLALLTASGLLQLLDTVTLWTLAAVVVCTDINMRSHFVLDACTG